LVLLGCGVFAAGMLFSGCGGQEQPTNQKGNGATRDTKSLAAIDECDNLIQLYERAVALRASGVPPDEAENKLIEKKWKDLLSKRKSIKICDEVDIVAFSYKKPTKPGERYLCSFLYRVKRDFTKDYLVSLMLYVDRAHLKYLPEAARTKGYDSWGWSPNPKTRDWKEKSAVFAGERYIFLRRGVVAAEIPYHIKTGFYLNDESGKIRSIYGKQADLGWFVDLGE